MSGDVTNITLAEAVIVESLSYSGKFLSRDESGDLWVTEEKPNVNKSESGDYLAFDQVKGIDGMHSLSVFNHMFNYIGKLDVIVIEKDVVSQINTSRDGVSVNPDKIVLDGSVEVE